MEIDFLNEKLKKLCNDAKHAKVKLGELSAKKLLQRLCDIDASNNVQELPPLGNPHPLKGERLGEFAISLHGGCRLVFVPNHNPIPTKNDVGLDWSCVTSITIIEIGDYHE